MKIGLVCSHGGHLTEMLRLLEAFDGHRTFFITYDSSRTRKLKDKYLLENIDRSPTRFLRSIPIILKILIKEMPDLIVSTGAEIAIPVFYLARLFRVKLIFLETLARVDKPSLTGKIVYPIADMFLVQWKRLLEKYGKKAVYEGAVI